MKEIFKEYNIDLEKRFNNKDYIVFDVPYILIGEENIPKVLEPEEVGNYKNIKTITAIFKKLNWSLDHDIRRQSRIFSLNSYKYEFNFTKYCENAIKKLLILVLDKETGKEQYINSTIFNSLHNSFAEGLVSYFFKNQPHQDYMEDDEQAELSLAIHNFFSYMRKKSYNDPSIAGVEPPPCPSIIMEKSIADQTGWTLDYIRNLSYRDITAMNICETQKGINEFEGSPAAREGMQVQVNGIMRSVKSIQEAKQMLNIQDEDLSDSNNQIEQEIMAENSQVESQPKPEIKEANSNVTGFLNKLLDNPSTTADDFFSEAQKRNKKQ